MLTAVERPFFSLWSYINVFNYSFQTQGLVANPLPLTMMRLVECVNQLYSFALTTLPA
jgi:hypothetical protein